jgi:beta-glucosidase
MQRLRSGRWGVIFALCAAFVSSCIQAGNIWLPPTGRLLPGGIDYSAFPSGFFWAAGSSSHQVEGNNVHSDWWQWEIDGRTQSGVVSGAAADHWNRYEEDFDHLLAVNLDTYRFSLSWARLYPHPGMTEPDPEAVAGYDNMFEALAARGIRPMVTLHHFAMPAWLTEEDRWVSGAAIDDFKQLAAFAASRWGGYVDWWVTINEPEVYAFHGWAHGVFPPGKHGDPFLGVLVMVNLMKAHAEAYHVIKRIDTIDADGDGKAAQVGVTTLMIPLHPTRPTNLMELIATQFISNITNSFWFVANRTGVIDLSLPFGPATVEEFPLLRGTLDYIGINYYSRQMLRYDPFRGFIIGSNPFGVHSMLGAETYPEGLYEVLAYTAQFGLPIIITENGIADPDDSMRADYIIRHLAVLSRFLRDRPDVSVLGYVHWSLTDNFEWENGFAPRFGLYAIDYATQQRTRRPSADVLAEIIATIRNHHP